MKNKSHLYILIILLASFLLCSCSHEESNVNIDHSFKVAKNVEYDIEDFDKVKFNSSSNLDLGFYEGEVWIKLDITGTKTPASYVVLCNDLINRNYKFYKLDRGKNVFIPQKDIDLEKYDHRSYQFSKPNFKIDLNPNEKATFLISTTSDGRILQASPLLITIDQFMSIKQQTLIFDIIFYSFVVILLIINFLYFRLVRKDIQYYYAAYILSGCLMYLFVEGRLYGLGINHSVIDHLMFISIRTWVLFGLLFTLNFLETKKNYPRYYRLTTLTLFLTIGITTIYQLVCYSFSISTLHQFENIIGFVWIIFSLATVGIAFKKNKVLSAYYLIPYSVFLLFVSLGLIDSHKTMLPGDPFSYFKIGTILEFIGFTYFISLLIKENFCKTESLESELNQKQVLLQKKEQILASNSVFVGSLKLVENSLSSENDWEQFKVRFIELNPQFYNRLFQNHPNLSKSEIRLLTLIKVGYSQKEIANILNIAPNSVKKARSRVRKKMRLDKELEIFNYLESL